MSPGNWSYLTLGEICAKSGGFIQTGPFGSQLHASDYTTLGVPVVMPVNIGENRLAEEGISRIPPREAARLERHKLRAGNIVYGRRGDIGRRALITKNEDGWLCGTGCLRIDFGTGVLDPEFAVYFLSNPETRDWIVRHTVGTTMPNLNTAILSAVPFAVPPLSEQRGIGRALGALDDKIELNRRMNQTLESMARAIFRSRFVDFDPHENNAITIGELIRRGYLEVGDGYRAKNSELSSSGLPFARAGDLNAGFDFSGADIGGLVIPTLSIPGGFTVGCSSAISAINAMKSRVRQTWLTMSAFATNKRCVSACPISRCSAALVTCWED